MRLSKTSAFFIALSIFLICPHPAKAADFNPNFLISDAEITDYNSMDQSDIQNFLQNRSGTLDNYLTFDKEGNPKTAVQSFYEIAQLWKINPKYLMVLTQKEQSLLEDGNPSQKHYDWATGYGVCDSCSMDDPTIQKFKGFYRQVNSAAAQTRYYMDNIIEFNFQPGRTYNIDGTSVSIQNTATAGLYNYTPHLHGNMNFVNLWTKYFGKKWPDGSLLTASNSSSSDVYLIQGGQKRLIASKAVFISLYDPKLLLPVLTDDLNTYEDGPPIKYLNFSILQSNSTGNRYMIVNDTKRKIASIDIFKKLGFSEDEAQTVSDSELQLYKDGADITEYTVYPTGALLQDAKAKKPFDNLFYVISGEKHPVLTKEILTANFSGLKIKKVTASELDGYMPSANIVLPDGWLVVSNSKPKVVTKITIVKKKKVTTKTTIPNAVYVISGGKRLPILDSSAFDKMGYNSKNIKKFSDETLNLIPIGATIFAN